jgi:hypothetical protein
MTCNSKLKRCSNIRMTLLYHWGLGTLIQAHYFVPKKYNLTRMEGKLIFCEVASLPFSGLEVHARALIVLRRHPGTLFGRWLHQ